MLQKEIRSLSKKCKLTWKYGFVDEVGKMSAGGILQVDT